MRQSKLNIVIRADAGSTVGHEHVLRCLTPAEALIENGHSVSFVCAEVSGNLADKIREKGIDCWLIKAVAWAKDAQQTVEIIGDKKIDWLIVDHYQLDYLGHMALRDTVDKILVIDDLAIWAGGSTAYECCVVGLPSIVIVIAENQLYFVNQLKKIGIISVDSLGADFSTKIVELIRDFDENIGLLKSQSELCSGLLDGEGVNRILNKISFPRSSC